MKRLIIPETGQCLSEYTEIQQRGKMWLDEPFTYYCFDGGARSGKTWFICTEIIVRALRYPQSAHLIARYRRTHLEMSVWRMTLLRILDPILHMVELDKVKLIVKLPNGAEIHGAALEEAERLTKIMGREYATVFVNEATEIKWSAYEMLKTRCVQNIPGCKNKMIVDCNPASQFHWIHRAFIDGVDPNDAEQPLKDKEKYCRFGPWLPQHNPHLGEDGLEIINSLSGAQYERLALGRWVSQEGLVYPDYADAIVEPFTVNPNWLLSAAVDFGFSNPFCFLWFAEDYANETYYLFDEYYSRGKTVKDHCQVLRTWKSDWTTRTRLEWIVADHDAEDRATMDQEGFPTLPAVKDIVTGIEAVTNMLRAKRGWKLRIFATCTNTLSEFSGYKYNDRKYGDDRDEKPVKGNDHSMDSLRYFCRHVLQPVAAKAFRRIK